MQIDMLKNAFLPDGSKSPTILKKGSIQEVSDEHGKILVDKGYALEFKPAKAEKPKKDESDKPAKAEKADTPAA